MQRLLTLAFLTSVGCGALVRVEPVKVDPIRMTIDVNVHSVADSPKPEPAR